MVSNLIFDKEIRNLHGIIIKESSNNRERLKFLTSEGECYIILQNSKHRQLKAKVGECVYVSGRIIEQVQDLFLEIFYFINEFEGSICDEEIENLNSSVELNNEIFFDYESIFT